MKVTSGSEGLLAEGGANWKRLEKGEVGAEGRGRAEVVRRPTGNTWRGNENEKRKRQEQHIYDLKTQTLGEVCNKEIKIIS